MGLSPTSWLPGTRWSGGGESAAEFQEPLGGGADVIRAIAQGRADGTIAIIDNWLKFTPNYPDVTWRVVPKTIYLGYWGIGVKRGNDSLRRWLNIWLYDHQSKNRHNVLWEKWFGSPPAFPVVPTPYFP
ncbi:MAG: transporter substrate-binding domain-containing protein [Rhodospirillales bacterium]|nr:transporter substrate-binding domain-containing protein [Rhodospirillales bacterium]